MDEMKALLGEYYDHYESAMQPVIDRKYTRGKPPSSSGDVPIRPAYKLPKSEEMALNPDDTNPLASTTMSVSGKLSIKIN